MCLPSPFRRKKGSERYKEGVPKVRKRPEGRPSYAAGTQTRRRGSVIIISPSFHTLLRKNGLRFLGGIAIVGKERSGNYVFRKDEMQIDEKK